MAGRCTRPFPYLPIDEYPGKLIAVEGTDGVGRSTQIQLLREWLEVRGYGVIETGWTRSPLMQPTIELAKSSNTLNKLTFVLLYATDFADRLEKEIIPALKAGFIVLSDRYIFTALARAGVRGVDRRSVISTAAIAPHMVFYLNIDVKTLIGRVRVARDGFLGNRDGSQARRRHRQLQNLSEQSVEGMRRWPTSSIPRGRAPGGGSVQDELRSRWRRSSSRSKSARARALRGQGLTRTDRGVGYRIRPRRRQLSDHSGFQRIDRRQPVEHHLPRVAAVAAREQMPALCADVDTRRLERIGRHRHPHHVQVRA